MPPQRMGSRLQERMHCLYNWPGAFKKSLQESIRPACPGIAPLLLGRCLQAARRDLHIIHIVLDKTAVTRGRMRRVIDMLSAMKAQESSQVKGVKSDISLRTLVVFQPRKLAAMCMQRSSIKGLLLSLSHLYKDTRP